MLIDGALSWRRVVVRWVVCYGWWTCTEKKGLTVKLFFKNCNYCLSGKTGHFMVPRFMVLTRHADSSVFSIKPVTSKRVNTILMYSSKPRSKHPRFVWFLPTYQKSICGTNNTLLCTIVTVLPLAQDQKNCWLQLLACTNEIWHLCWWSPLNLHSMTQIQKIWFLRNIVQLMLTRMTKPQQQATVSLKNDVA